MKSQQRLWGLILASCCSTLAGCASDIVFTQNGELRRIVCGVDNPIAVNTTSNEGAQWSPDGNRVAYLGFDTAATTYFC
jgi:hypothetical protein